MTSSEILELSGTISTSNQYLEVADKSLKEKQRSDAYEVWYQCDGVTPWQTIEFIFYPQGAENLNSACNMIVPLYAKDRTSWEFKIPFKAFRVVTKIGSTVTLQALELYAVVEDNITLEGVVGDDDGISFTGDQNYVNSYDYVKDANGKITALTRSDGTTISFSISGGGQ